MILLIRTATLKAYLDDPERVRDQVGSCPRCQHQPLSRHGTRRRWVYGPDERRQIPIFRLRCPACGVTYTLLPDVLVPHFRYLGALIERAIAAYLDSPASLRTIAVHIAGIILPDDLSVTDALLTVRLTPSYQRLHAWVRRLGELAAPYAQALTTWLARLRPDTLALDLLAAEPPSFALKARSTGSTRNLHDAALLLTLLRRTPELQNGGSWLPLLDRLVLAVTGRIPWRAPPPTDGLHPARDVPSN